MSQKLVVFTVLLSFNLWGLLQSHFYSFIKVDINGWVLLHLITLSQTTPMHASVKRISMCSGIGLSLSGCQAILRTKVDLQSIQDYIYITPNNTHFPTLKSNDYAPILARLDQVIDDVTGYIRISDIKILHIYTNLQSSAGKRGNIVNRNWMSTICNRSRVTTGLGHHTGLSHQTGLALPWTVFFVNFGELCFYSGFKLFLLVRWSAVVYEHVSLCLLVLLMVADSFVCGFIVLFLFISLCCKLYDFQGPGRSLDPETVITLACFLPAM